MSETIAKAKPDPQCPYCKGIGWLREKDLEVADKGFGEPRKCTCFLKAQAEAEFLRRSTEAQLTGWLAQANFAEFKVLKRTREQVQGVREFSAAGTGWVTLWGGYGNGKTHLLAATVNDNLLNGRRAVYYTLSDLLDKVRGSYKDDDYDQLMTFLSEVDLLAIDEVDKAKATPWVVEKIYQLFDARYRAMTVRGTIFAMNVDPTQKLEEGTPLDYLFSRMNDERCQIYEMNAGDMRKLTRKLEAKNNERL